MLGRLGAAVDAFLLKIVAEEHLGWPVQLTSDGLDPELPSALHLNGAASVYDALAAGHADVYPQVRGLVRALAVGGRR